MSEEPPVSPPAQGCSPSGHLGIHSRPGDDGKYRLHLTVDDDHYEMSQTEAVAWVLYVATAGATAEHDAALLRQGTTIGMQRDLAGVLVVAARDNRPAALLEPPLDIGLTFRPGVSSEFKPFVTIYRNDEPVGQWDSGDVYDYISGMMIAIATVELDDSLHQTLVEEFNLEPLQAKNMISDLPAHAHTQHKHKDPDHD